MDLESPSKENLWTYLVLHTNLASAEIGFFKS